MRNAVLSTVVALLALTTLGLSQDPAQISFTYPGDWDCPSHLPLSYGAECWQGTPIPEGTLLEFYKNGAPHATFPLNSEFICEVVVGGFFATDYIAGYVAGDRVQLHVTFQGCHYWAGEWTLVAGATQIELYEENWACDCSEDSCSALNPQEEGEEGPRDIPTGDTVAFIDNCTVRITAQGGIAHGVTVGVYDNVPQYHPTGFSYMSRVVGIFWDGSVDPSTTLLVRMYHTEAEMTESGFMGASCLIAARFEEFAAKWSPIPRAGSGLKYIEFVTDRSGYFTFDCRGTTPRSIPVGGPSVSSGDGELVVRWQTMDEFENYRFHILRADNSDGPYVEVATLNSQLPDIRTTASFDYEYRDSGLENGRTYHYRLRSEDLHGNTVDCPTTVCGVPSLYGDAVEIQEYRLHAAYPNPFNPETRITYDVRDAGRVTLCVFDILGREVARLVDGEQPRGRYSVSFNARDLPSGLYFYRIDIGGQFTSTQKMLLLK